MRKALLFIASVLLAATASAQIGNPGFGAPPLDLTSAASATALRSSGFLQSGAVTTVTSAGKTLTHNGVAGHLFTVNSTSPNAKSTLQLTGGSVRLAATDNSTFEESYFTLAKDGFTPSELSVQGTDFTMSAVNPVGGQSTIVMNLQDSGAISFYASDQIAAATAASLRSYGFAASKWQDAAWGWFLSNEASYITGGYGVSPIGVGVDTTIDVTVTDTTPSITDGDVQVCGLDSTNFTSGIVTCEVLDFSTGAGTQTTALGFRVVTHIKTSSFATLDGGGDEQISAAFTAGATVRTATNIVNHTASAILDGGGAGPGAFPDRFNDYNYITLKCLDLLGCSLDSIVAPGGSTSMGDAPVPVTIMVAPGSTSVTAADSATLKVSAAHTLDEYDTLSLVWSPAATAWLQTSVSVN